MEKEEKSVSSDLNCAIDIKPTAEGLNWFRCCPPRVGYAVAIRGENQST